MLFTIIFRWNFHHWIIKALPMEIHCIFIICLYTYTHAIPRYSDIFRYLFTMADILCTVWAFNLVPMISETLSIVWQKTNDFRIKVNQFSMVSRNRIISILTKKFYFNEKSRSPWLLHCNYLSNYCVVLICLSFWYYFDSYTTYNS